MHGGAPVDIITTHLKSKLLTFGGNFSTSNETLRAHTAFFALERRAAEANGLRNHVNGLLTTNRHVIVLGDLNDGPEAATTEILYGPPGGQPRGRMTLRTLLVPFNGPTSRTPGGCSM